jgi:type I restriction enzyme, S subunit
MKTTLRPYPKYRESHLPWLGQIPAHWQVRRIGSVFAQRNETGYGELPILEVSFNTGIRVRDFDGTSHKQVMSDKEKYKRAIRGDIAYNMMRLWQGAVGVVPTDGLVSPAYVVAKPHPENASPYFVELFRTAAYKAEVNKYSHGIVSDRNRLYWDEFKQMPVCVPPPEEQATIVRFLALGDQSLRRFIQAKRRLIKLLDEQKQSVVHRAVTHGLNFTGSMKSTTNLGLGDVPSHWEVLPLKRVLRKLIDCEHKTAPAVDQSEYRVVRTTGIRHGMLRLNGTYCTNELAFGEWTRRGNPEAGDVIFTREAPAGEACVVPEGLRLCLGQRTVLMKLIRTKLDPQFLVHMIYAGPPRVSILLASQGSTVDHFNMSDIGSLTIVLPPLPEQLAIVAAISEQTAILDSVIRRTESEIELFREYRTRLLADVLTGRIDVREIGKNLPWSSKQQYSEGDPVDSEETEDLDYDSPELLPVSSDED